MEYRLSKFARFAWIALTFAAVMGLVVMLLWNWLIPVLFSGPHIGFGQAIGLLVLSKILFGGFGPGRWRHHAHMRQHWRKKFGEKMAAMSPEEKEAFRQRFGHFKGRCGSRWQKWAADWEIKEPGDEQQPNEDEGKKNGGTEPGA